MRPRLGRWNRRRLRLACAFGLGLWLLASGAEVATAADVRPVARPGVSVQQRRAIVRDRLRRIGPAERQRIRRQLMHRYRKAGPEQRRRMRREIRDGVRKRMGERMPSREELRAWRRKQTLHDARMATRGLKPSERRALRAKVAELGPLQRQIVLKKLAALHALPADQLAIRRDRLLRYLDSSESERARLRENAQRWRDMEEGERVELREAFQRLKEMPAEERSELLETLLPADAGEE